jgi:hypothetical protein
LVERSLSCAFVAVPDVTADTLKIKLQQHVAKTALLVTDNAGQYHKTRSTTDASDG